MDRNCKIQTFSILVHYMTIRVLSLRISGTYTLGSAPCDGLISHSVSMPMVLSDNRVLSFLISCCSHLSLFCSRTITLKSSKSSGSCGSMLQKCLRDSTISSSSFWVTIYLDYAEFNFLEKNNSGRLCCDNTPPIYLLLALIWSVKLFVKSVNANRVSLVMIAFI